MLTQPTKYRAIAISVVLFLTFDLGVLVPNFMISSQLKQSAIGINLSGRQRMLSQRTVKALLQINVAQQANQSIKTAQAELRLAYQLFDETLEGFDSGKNVTGGDGKSVYLEAVTTDKAKDLIKQSKQIWITYQQKLAPILASQEIIKDRDLKEAIEYAANHNLKLLKLMNDLTTELEHQAGHKASFLQIIQITGMVLALINFFIVLSHSLKNLQKNDRLLAQAYQEIESLNQQLKTENIRMKAELEVTQQLQTIILPRTEELESIADLDIVGFMQPASEVGGDYYDVLYYDGVVTITIGDVTGHGLESGILMVMTQAAIRTLKEVKENDPIHFLDTLNRAIYRNLQRMESDRNLTLVVLNYCQGKVSISGQHEEVIVVRKGGQIERIDTMNLGLPIGLDEEIIDFIDQAFFELNSGDGIVLYTDGITEAKDLNKNLYGLERLCAVISQNWESSVEDIKKAIIADVIQYIGLQKVFDDITLLVVKQK